VLSERGIVITPRFDFSGQRISTTGGLEAEDLRRYLLYWDKIDYPHNKMISTGAGPNEQFLIEAGVLSRTEVRLDNFSGDIRYGYSLAQVRALQMNNQREPGL
jgi:hypothetical protein